MTWPLVFGPVALLAIFAVGLIPAWRLGLFSAEARQEEADRAARRRAERKGVALLGRRLAADTPRGYRGPRPPGTPRGYGRAQAARVTQGQAVPPSLGGDLARDLSAEATSTVEAQALEDGRLERMVMAWSTEQ